MTKDTRKRDASKKEPFVKEPLKKEPSKKDALRMALAQAEGAEAAGNQAARDKAARNKTARNAVAEAAPPDEPRAWSKPVRVKQIPDQGAQFDLVADEAICAELALEAGVRAFSNVRAQVKLKPVGEGDILVTGRVRGIAGQNCVVTLEPVDDVIDEEFEALYLPYARKPAASAPASASESTAEDATIEDPPEIIVNGMIDVAALATEWLFLGIDPYPRKAGIAFEPVIEAPEPEEHPFAALQTLKEAAQGGRQGGEDDGDAPPSRRPRDQDD